MSSIVTKCIVCDNTELSKYTDNSGLGLPVYQCKQCKLYFTGNSESTIKEKTSTLYHGQYWDERKAEFSFKSDYIDPDSQSKKRNWISQYAYCKSYFKDKKTLLEIGAGAGQASFWFEKEGFFVTAIEPDERNVKLINEKLTSGHCTQGFIEDIEIEGKFDVIWMSHVLEHLVRPDYFLKKIKENLQENGIFFIEVPNCENASMLEASINEPHTFHFSGSTLLNLAKNSGYKIECCDFFRPATIIEGGLNKIIKNTGIKIEHFACYPRIKTSNKKGRDLRLIIRK